MFPAQDMFWKRYIYIIIYVYMFYFKVLSTYSALNKHICNRFVLLFKNQENIRLRDAPYFHTKYLMYVQRIVRNNK